MGCAGPRRFFLRPRRTSLDWEPAWGLLSNGSSAFGDPLLGVLGNETPILGVPWVPTWMVVATLGGLV